VVRVEDDIILPKVSYDEARRVLTRTDFVDSLNHLHVSWQLHLSGSLTHTVVGDNC
jgi:hypothetical protein